MGQRRREAERASIPIPRRRFGSSHDQVQADDAGSSWRVAKAATGLHVDLALAEECSRETANDGFGDNNDYFRLAWRHGRGARRSSRDKSGHQIGRLGHGDHHRSVLRRSFLFRSFSSGQVTHQNNVGRPWCLHDYADDEVDCSYANRSQCAATAAGGLGECSPD
jgi:hypothetical protein